MTLNVLGPQAGNQVTTRPARATARGASLTWHKPCSSPTAQDGTVADADMFNDLIAQFRDTFTQSGITFDGADDMLWRSIQSLGTRYAVDTGSAGAAIIANTIPIGAFFAGLPFLVKFAASPTSTTNTITVDALAAKNLLDANGDALQPGAYKAGYLGWCIYDGAAVRVTGLRKSPGFLASATGLACTDSVFNAVSPISTSTSTLGTSTFSNGTFTCGAGEAGWWLFNLDISFVPGSVSDGSSIAPYITGPSIQNAHHNAQFSGNQGNRATVASLQKLVAGNTVLFTGYRLTGSGTMAAVVSGIRVGA